MTTFNKHLSLLRLTSSSFEIPEATIKFIDDIFSTDIPTHINVFISNINGGTVIYYNLVIGYLKTIKILRNITFHLYASGNIMSAGINILACNIFDKIVVDTQSTIMLHNFGATINDQRFRNINEIDELKSMVNVGEKAQEYLLLYMQGIIYKRRNNLKSIDMSNLPDPLKKIK